MRPDLGIPEVQLKLPFFKFALVKLRPLFIHLQEQSIQDVIGIPQQFFPFNGILRKPGIAGPISLFLTRYARKYSTINTKNVRMNSVISSQKRLLDEIVWLTTKRTSKSVSAPGNVNRYARVLEKKLFFS